jgi:hypothetical protein
VSEPWVSPGQWDAVEAPRMGAWDLLDAEQMHAEHPDKFFLLDASIRSSLSVGSTVKLHFVGADGLDERMWVQVTEITRTGDESRYIGELRNDPVRLALAWGDPVAFEARHVLDVEGER